jgi:hypothetical protein
MKSDFYSLDGKIDHGEHGEHGEKLVGHTVFSVLSVVHFSIH